MSAARGQSMGRSRAIPAQLKRQVWERDEGRCGFIGEDEHRCSETRGLEYAHLQPWGKGGQHSLENLGLRCRAHNAYEASRDYGVEFMQDKRCTRQPVCRVREPVQRYQVGVAKFAATGHENENVTRTSTLTAGRGSKRGPSSGRECVR